MNEPPLMNASGMTNLRDVYRDGLLNDVVPFWIRHCVDREHGGFLFALDREGRVISPDKYLWIHGRFVWLLSTLYATVEPREEWLALARHGLEFLNKYGFDRDGRMFFTTSRDGRPLRKRRYLFSECFTIAAKAAYAKAAKDQQVAQEALDLFKLVIRYHTTPGLLEPKVNPAVRPMKGLAMPMMLIVTAQILRDTLSAFPSPSTEDGLLCQGWIDRAIGEIEQDFMKEEFKAALETVGPKGEFIDTFEGRLICPGHSMECVWFILAEAKHRGRQASHVQRPLKLPSSSAKGFGGHPQAPQDLSVEAGDPHLLKVGLKLLDWSWQQGWDEEYGGILYYRDAKGHPPTEYWHDMKDWWPHNEAIIATLLAYQLTKEQKYAEWHQRVHDWSYAHFPDPEYGEWFGYLRRDGRVSTTLKGNNWKGPFHLPRMQLVCWKILEDMLPPSLGFGETRPPSP